MKFTSPALAAYAFASFHAVLTTTTAEAPPAFDSLARINAATVPIVSGGGYPRLARVGSPSAGTVLASYTYVSRADNTTTLRVSKSVDNGTSFRPLSGAIASARSAARDLDNAVLLYLPALPANASIAAAHPGAKTAILAAFRNHDRKKTTAADGKGKGGGADVYFRITLSYSVDGGATWSYLSQAAEGVQGLWEPFLRLGAGGEVQLSYSQTLAAKDQATFSVASYDGGTTWTAPPRALLGHGSALQVRDGMQSVVEVVDGATGQRALLLCYETNYVGTLLVQCAASYDGGASWGARQTVYQPPKGHNAGAPQVAAYYNNDNNNDNNNGDGDDGDGSNALVLVFMTDDDLPAADVDWPARGVVKAVVSRRGLVAGKVAWSAPARVSAAGMNGAWPGALAVNDTSVLVAYQQQGGRTVARAVTLL